jgi:hypothetical protein
MTQDKAHLNNKQEQKTGSPQSIPQIWSIQNGQLKLNFHTGQSRTWMAQKRFNLMLAGTQGGKTSFGGYGARSSA